MLEQTTVVVGEDELVIESLPATVALQLLTKTIKIVGGASKGVQDFPSSLKEFQDLAKNGLGDYIHLGNMVEGLLDRIDTKEVPDLIKATIRASLPLWRDKPGKGEGSFEDWFENRFSREFGDLFQLLFEIYKYNYREPVGWLGSFFLTSLETNPPLPDPGQAEQS